MGTHSGTGRAWPENRDRGAAPLCYGQPVDHDDAKRFSESWVAAWNSHDLDAILAHFSDDTVFTSPVAAQLLAGSDGIVKGKSALRDYWGQGLAKNTDLHFDVEAVYVGINTIVINYRNQRGNRVNEVLRFEHGLAVEGHGTYLSDDALSASGLR
jgi:ketosteroid isomerase-like protein